MDRWKFTTEWHRGQCRIDNGECLYCASFDAVRAASMMLRPVDVTQLESMFAELAGKEPTIAEELLATVKQKYAERFGEALEHRCNITVFCKSAKHGVLEVSV